MTDYGLQDFFEKVKRGVFEAVRDKKCVPGPFGCGGPATEFTDEISRKEYTISGLCQRCQDSIFNKGD
jgi:hypothetical protein